MERETDATASIGTEGTTFNMTVEEFCEALNNDLKEKELEQIPEEFITTTYGSGESETYECIDTQVKITDSLSLVFYTFPELGNNPAVVMLRCKGSPRIDDETQKMADRYYQVLCENIEPGFVAENFNTISSHNEQYRMNGKIFYCIFSLVTEGNAEEYSLRTYGIHMINLDEKYQDI